MSSVQLNEADLRAFLTAFNAVADVTGYTFDDETEYRLAIANLVGELRSQLGSVPCGPIAVVPRIPLAELLAEKYAAWDVACAGGAECQSADSLIEETLDRYPFARTQFTGGAGAAGAVEQLRVLATAGTAVAWQRYQLVVCTFTREELDGLTLAEMLSTLLAVGDEPAGGGSFWGRWKKK
jgi:hypothetical protein